MKKISIVALLAGFVFFGMQGSSTTVSAQNQGKMISTTVDQIQFDRQLAEYIRQKTNRSTAGLVEQVGPDGSLTVDLEGRFQHLMLGKLNPHGQTKTGCISDIRQANAFYSRDLETGQMLPYNLFPADEYSKQAEQHGMTRQEFLFYKRMVEVALQEKLLSPNAATISIVNNDGAGEGFNDPTAVTPEGGNNGTTRGQQRLNVFDFAADIWEAFLDSNVTIHVRSQFDPLPCSPVSAVLGGASTTTLHGNFANARLNNTWYVQALANKQSGADLSASPDLNATFNSTINGTASCLGGARFYLGLDNSTPGGTINLLITVMHEIGHGVGFSSFVDETDGTFFMGFSDTFTTFIYDRTTDKLWNDMTDAERMASAINTNNVLWDGPSIKLASGDLLSGRDNMNGRVELYTPNPVEVGSSVSHFNTTVFPNALMEPDITLNLPLTLDLTRQLMRDLGWYRDTTSDVIADTITNVSPGAGTLMPGTQATVTWTNNGGFNKNVTIEISTDGGATYPNALATNIVNSGTFNFTVPGTQTSQAKIRVREHNFAEPVGESNNFSISNNMQSVKPIFDFDGDSKTDVSIFRPGPGEWWYLRSSDGGNNAFQFGTNTDTLVPADYTGDGKTDIAFWRPSTGEWFILRSEDSSFFSFPFGVNGDIPAPGDFDGDGMADAAVYRPSNGTWFILNSSGGTRIEPFGISEDKPVVGDYDGDGMDDIAIFRPSSAQWWLNRSTDGVVVYQFGAAGDQTVQGDYTGDGKTDVAFFRPSTGFWFVVRSEDDTFFGFPFGINGDIPSPGDYDGDGEWDAAVFRPSTTTWFINGSTSGTQIIGFGLSGDVPLPSVYSVP
jgi:hypothetical protein